MARNCLVSCSPFRRFWIFCRWLMSQHELLFSVKQSCIVAGNGGRTRRYLVGLNHQWSSLFTSPISSERVKNNVHSLLFCHGNYMSYAIRKTNEKKRWWRHSLIQLSEKLTKWEKNWRRRKLHAEHNESICVQLSIGIEVRLCLQETHQRSQLNKYSARI